MHEREIILLIRLFAIILSYGARASEKSGGEDRIALRIRRHNAPNEAANDKYLPYINTMVCEHIWRGMYVTVIRLSLHRRNLIFDKAHASSFICYRISGTLT